MDEHFAKIRTQLSSKLPNQQMHATTLLAVEEVLGRPGLATKTGTTTA